MSESNEQQWRAQLERRVKQIPEGVRNGSHNVAVRFKKWAGQAGKALNSTRTTAQVFQALCNEYDSY
jgi:hypothetical protein